MEFNFTGKTILVTGAGRGIGRAIAIALAKANCKVYALSKTKSTLDTLIEEYPSITPIVQDLINWDETRKALEQIEALDGLVNNAGLSPYVGPAYDHTKEHLEFYINNNMLSVINCTQVISQKMIEAGKSGSIVNISSIIGPLSQPRFLGYGLAKAGVDFATKQFALELGPHNIRVNSVNPTLVKTELSAKNGVNIGGIPFDQVYIERNPLQRVAEPEEIVGPVLYLLSNASAMVTGTIHFVDGGQNCNITTRA